jgi:transcriptional regulator with XRE-family HTH domain
MTASTDLIWSRLHGVEIGELIRATRRERGLDQAALARRAGTTQTYISRIERGAVSPSWSTVERLFAAMGRHLVTKVEPLPRGNEPLGRALRPLSPTESVEAAFELSEFLTGVSVSAAAGAGSGEARGPR